MNNRDNLSVVYEFGNSIYTNFIVAESVMGVVAIERIRTAKGSLMILKGQVQDVLSLLAAEKESSTKKMRILEEKVENLIIEG